MSKKVFITGITGQAGAVLADMCLSRGDKVYGLVRRTSTPSDSRIKHLISNPDLEIVQGDVTDGTSICHAIGLIHPDYYFNAAAQSHVHFSFKEPLNSFNTTALGCVNALEALRLFSPTTKYLQFSTSELYGFSYDERVVGDDTEKYQNEQTKKTPNSPYAVAKLAAHEMTRLYRTSYHLFACCAIFFNMESKYRTETFVTRKITRYIGKLVAKSVHLANLKVSDTYFYNEEKLKNFPKLMLGNVKSMRDWQHVRDAMRGALLVLEQDKPDDFLFATGCAHSIEEFLHLAFSMVNLDWKNFVEFDATLLRPSEVPFLKGDASKAKNILNWESNISFIDLVKEMVEADVELGLNEVKYA